MNTDIRDIPKLIRVKDPRSVWAVVCLVIAIALFGIVSRLLIMSIIERDLLQGDLDATRARIVQIQGMQGTNPETLRQRIEERRQELQEVLAGFPTTQQVDEEIGRYYQYAGELGTQLVRMEAMLNTPEEEGQSAYRVQRFLLGVRGEMPQLLRFLGRITNVPYRGLVLDAIAIRPDNALGGAGGGAVSAIANADLAVYASDLVSGTAPIPQEVAPAPTATLGQSDNISEIEAFMRRAIADQDWAAAVAHGRHILQLDPGRQDIVRALYQAHLSWGRALAAAGQVAEAQQQYNEALTLVPDGQEAQDALRALGTPTPAPAGLVPGDRYGATLQRRAGRRVAVVSTEPARAEP
jgi:tetratricopeptide (TPR) repeat protein